jgi:hypothetical protein
LQNEIDNQYVTTLFETNPTEMTQTLSWL